MEAEAIGCIEVKKICFWLANSGDIIQEVPYSAK